VDVDGAIAVGEVVNESEQRQDLCFCSRWSSSRSFQIRSPVRSRRQAFVNPLVLCFCISRTKEGFYRWRAE
jgi:hypothetical protein